MEDHPPNDFFVEESKTAANKRPQQNKKNGNVKASAEQKPLRRTAGTKDADRKGLTLASETTKILPDDLEKMFSKIKEQHDDLTTKLQFMYEQPGIGGKKIKDFLSDPNNFTPEQWDRIQQKSKEKLNKLFSGLGERTKKLITTKEEKIASKGRKTKTIGTRKKWLQM